MLTLLIVGILIALPVLIYGYKNDEPDPFHIGWALMLIAAFLPLFSMLASKNNIPDGYQRIENYSYVTDAGATETLAGPFYKKDGTYFAQEFAKTAYWVPFGECDYVEIDLPESGKTEG